MRILEGLPLHFHIRELSLLCKGSRIQRVIHDEREIRLQIHHTGLTGWLVISCHPEKSAVFFDPEKKPFKKTRDSGWERLLTKYLTGATIEMIDQVGWDRIMVLTIQNLNLWEQHTCFHLYAELTGRNANCILTMDNDQQTILGALRTVSVHQNRYRTIMPGEPYRLPPRRHDRMNPLRFVEQSEDDIESSPNPEDISSWMIHTIDGIGPTLSSTIARQVTFQDESVIEEIRTLLKITIEPLRDHSYQAIVFYDRQTKKPLGISWLGMPGILIEPFDVHATFNHAIVAFQKSDGEWQTRDAEHRNQVRAIRRELEYIRLEEEKIHSLLLPDWEIAALQLKGELLKLYPQSEEKNLHQLRMPNLFSSKGEEVLIEIDPRFSISQNMQRYFHRYRKAMLRNNQLRRTLEVHSKKKDFYLSALETGDPVQIPASDLPERTVTSSSEGTVERFRTPLGNEIIAGKNNRANHRLVTRLANRNDYWFHVRNLPGSHVILKTLNEKIDPAPDFLRAARLAASLSSAKQSSRAEVIMTRVKYLRLVPGQSLGKVTFRNEQTLVVEPTRPAELVSVHQRS